MEFIETLMEARYSIMDYLIRIGGVIVIYYGVKCIKNTIIEIRNEEKKNAERLMREKLTSENNKKNFKMITL